MRLEPTVPLIWRARVLPADPGKAKESGAAQANRAVKPKATHYRAVAAKRFNNQWQANPAAAAHGRDTGASKTKKDAAPGPRHKRAPPGGETAPGMELGFCGGPDGERNTLPFLALLDEHTRQCLAVHAGRSIRAVDAITVIEAAIARYGAPEYQ